MTASQNTDGWEMDGWVRQANITALSPPWSDLSMHSDRQQFPEVARAVEVSGSFGRHSPREWKFDVSQMRLQPAERLLHPRPPEHDAALIGN